MFHRCKKNHYSTNAIRLRKKNHYSTNAIRLQECNKAICQFFLELLSWVRRICAEKLHFIEKEAFTSFGW